MASEWAKAQAELQFGGMGSSNLVNRIAEALDVAYFTGANNAVQRVECETNKIRREIARMDVPDGE